MANGDFKKTNEKKADGGDSFWDMDFMLPPKKTTAAFSRDTEAVEVDLTHAHDVKSSGSVIPKKGTPKPASAKKTEPIFAYEPRNPLIKKVSVWHWPSKYSFYERFRADAIKYYHMTAEECPFVEFFSYMPQFMQLDRNQLSYYLWWRDNVRRRIWLRTDYSYIFLYIYETLNLPDFISPAVGLERLCDIWLAYREQFPKLDRYLTEWVCDYCLVNLMEPPFTRLAPIMGAILDRASFKEFYLKSDSDRESFYVSALINFASNYNWRAGKFYNEDTSELFETHIEGAFLKVIRETAGGGRFPDDAKMFIPARLTRDAFAGALCAYNIKRRVDVEYVSCTRSPEIRMLVTDIIKYAENSIRAILGVKSRFNASSLTDEIKKHITEYFEPFKPEKKAKKDEEPEYMKLYEAAGDSLSPESALDIEKRSWEVTNRLIEAFADDKDDISACEEYEEYEEYDIEDIEADAADPDAITGSISPFVIEGLNILLETSNGSNDFARWSEKNNMMQDTAAEIINEALYDTIGDIVTEDTGEGYCVIDDYLNDVLGIIKNGNQKC